MSERHIESGSSAQCIEQRAAEWIERRAFGRWTEVEAAALESWLEASIHHQVAFYRLEFSWDRTARLSALGRASSQKRGPSGRNWMDRAKLIAAALAVAALCAGGAYRFFAAPAGNVYATDIGGHKILTLPDGSTIELNTNTQVRVAAGAESRMVWLTRGEAFFQIKHDAVHPFVVMAGNHKVTDLGTKFVVRRRKEGVAVSVVEGSARLETEGLQNKAHSADLMPGDVALATATSLSVSRAPIAALNNELGWRNGVLIFHETSLAEAAAEFNRYNRQKLIVPDASIAKLTVDGTFPANRIETFARLTRDVLGLRVEKREGEIVITR